MEKFKSAFNRFKSRIQADYEASQSNKKKYEDEYQPESLAYLLIKDIGIQSMAAIRLMQFADEASVPFGGEVMSRLIRYIYNMEVHWKANIDPGTTLVHGVGLVISKYAHIGPNCTIAQNVTFGASWNHATGKTEGPVLEENVFVGPGAALLGPITIGKNSKIMAGAVVSESVPPNSIVKPAAPTLVKRSSSRKDAAKKGAPSD